MKVVSLYRERIKIVTRAFPRLTTAMDWLLYNNCCCGGVTLILRSSVRRSNGHYKTVCVELRHMTCSPPTRN